MAAGPQNAYVRAMRRMRIPLLAVAGLSALVNLLMLTAPVYMLQVYDRVLTSGSQATLQGLFILVTVLFIFLGLFDFLRGRILSRSAHILDAELGELAFARWLQLPGNRGSGFKNSAQGSEADQGQALRDLETLRGFWASPAPLGLFDLPWLPLYLGLLTLIHPLLGALTLAGAVVVVAAALVNQRLAAPGLEAAGRHDANERIFTDQGRRHAELIAALGMGGRIGGQWRRLHDTRLAAGQSSAERSEGVGVFSKTFRMFLQSAMLTLAAWLVLGQELSAGMIIASSVISGRALAPVDQIIGQWKAIGRARAAHRRAPLLFAGSPAPALIDLPAPTGRITLSNLCKFAPGGTGSGGAAPARLLDRIDLVLEPGDGLGVIGPSASGKSVLARVLTGAWQPDLGEIRLDGATPDQWDPEILGRHIGYLPQLAELLPGSIRDNIARFDPWAEDAQVIAAAQLAGVHEMILALPQGYATRTGNSCPLSGGQIQRLGLARALFGLPRIVVLDEPNANLDHEGDEALRRAILTLRSAGSTVIVMAHRPSALAAVNKVLVLRDGRTDQFGPRDEVLDRLTRAAAGQIQGSQKGGDQNRVGQQTAGMAGEGQAPSSRPGSPRVDALLRAAMQHPPRDEALRDEAGESVPGPLPGPSATPSAPDTSPAAAGKRGSAA